MRCRGVMQSRAELWAYVAAFAHSPLARWAGLYPWELTARSGQFVAELVNCVPQADFAISDAIAIHHTARIEDGSVIKGPAVIGPDCLIASGAYVRGGTWLESDVIVGPGAELKSSYVFSGSKLAHFNFVGDSVLGRGVNLEAGSVIANRRNERADTEIRVRQDAGSTGIGARKFGALVGDDCRIGANAVVAPGALLRPGTVLGRLALLDQERDA